MPDPTRNRVLQPPARLTVGEPEESGSPQTAVSGECTICRRIRAWDEKYLFWFLHENYSFPETLEALTRSLGFCFTHGAQAALDPSGQSSLTLVYEILSRRVGSILSRNRSRRSTGRRPLFPLSAPARCPACRNRDDALNRELSSLADEGEPPVSDGRSLAGSLCSPHFRDLVPRLSLPMLRRILPLYESALSRALNNAAGEPERDAEASPEEPGSDGNDPLPAALHVAAGQDGGPGTFPLRLGREPGEGIRNPVKNFLEDLSSGDACPVCKEMGRAWAEWMGWLSDNLSRGVEADDLLPVCPAHLRATFRLGDRRLASASVRNALRLARNRVRQGSTLISSPQDPTRGNLPSRLSRSLFGNKEPLRKIQRTLGRTIPCPVCHRLAVATDRALLLLFALLESPPHRARFAEGYGLCLRHFSRALSLEPSRTTRAILADATTAHLALLQWELEESSRKDAWTFRPEAAGTEHTAWERAIRRFSGSFPECDE